MEINAISPEQKAALVNNNKQGSPEYTKGEIISAEVVSQEGEVATLLAEGEKYFTAKIVSGLQFSAGDTLELLVNGKQNGNFVMTMVSGDADRVILSSQDAVNQDQIPKDINILNALKSAGLPVDETNTAIISEAMAENPDMDVKSAVFMLSNKIPFTKENVNALLSFENSQDSAGNKLIDIAGLAIFTEDYVTSSKAQVQMPENNALNDMQTLSEASHFAGHTLEVPTLESLSAQDPSMQGVPLEIMVEQAADNLMTEPTQTIDSGKAQLSADTQAAETRAEQLQYLDSIIENGNEDNKAENNIISDKKSEAFLKSQNALKDDNVKELLSKVMKSFVKIDDLISKETNIKKAGLSNMQKYLELKRTIDNSDILNKGAMSDKAQELISQNKVTADVKDYNFYHVPINFGQNRQTAEIFVYKRGGKKQKGDDESLKILIGLDTQNLGRFEVFAQAKNKSLSIKIGRENEAADALINSKTDELRKLIGETGYSLSSISIEKLFEKTTPVNAKDALETFLDDRTSKIDYMI